MKQLMTHARSRVTYFVFQYYNLQEKTAATVLLHRGRITVVIWDAHTKYRLKTDRHDQQRSLRSQCKITFVAFYSLLSGHLRSAVIPLMHKLLWLPSGHLRRPWLLYEM
jgi:hypothetical protein